MMAGSIINISSISGNVTMPKGIGYGASKAALNKWTKHAALNLAQYGIRVNVVAPGVIEAGMNEDKAISNPELWEQA
ncbi:SDR family NAD(P)-dependent oxidoreductase [Legionella maioricensis]|uniref:SDR family NAD(P)-dependent oxidoreductase n=1 Tax=Legionella maioricensis TaxID=2896528 RepID=A0A9X2D0B9_9GAMM|nr:SDR family NAD(P)-dependent oxidoreductase [Legionella maioricensis]MCL9683969.1 SDR family NAD(P)-dependent oxidoreductase [Legionella maioricensis]MCL9687986.1 SDR family NAD(P)-dependent oxidoreductase [Legionella maioricensis]